MKRIKLGKRLKLIKKRGLIACGLSTVSSFVLFCCLCCRYEYPFFSLGQGAVKKQEKQKTIQQRILLGHY